MCALSSGRESQRVRQARERGITANKACVPCRARKVKCDAAIVGIPCSGCKSRDIIDDCVPHVRKCRTRRNIQASRDSSHALSSPVAVAGHQTAPQSRRPSLVQVPAHERSNQTQPDLLYLNILDDAVGQNSYSNRQHITLKGSNHSSLRSAPISGNICPTRLPHLDDTDNEYLTKKGVFNLPTPQNLDALIKVYFTHAHPFSPVINRGDFIRGYQSGDGSFFLLRVILALAIVHAPADLIAACGFSTRAAAQESFFHKAKLLHSFAPEDDHLTLLQGSIILCMVILDCSTNWDFSYWFHDAIRLARKLNIRRICMREEKPPEVLKLYRRIWWNVYSLDVFYVFANSRSSPLLEHSSTIRPRTEDDWETEDSSDYASHLLPSVSNQQKEMPVVLCELSRIFVKVLPFSKDRLDQEYRQIVQELDTWREALASKMQVGSTASTDVCYLNAKAMSFRYECILCRVILRRGQRSHSDVANEWIKQRFQSAILELDAIAMRVLTRGNIQDFPTAFITTMTALLALHIESALDPNEKGIIRSMARISISQTMLVINQGREIPVLKRALPVFEDILRSKNLYLVAPDIACQTSAQLDGRPQGNIVANAYSLAPAENGTAATDILQREHSVSFDMEFMDFGIFDESFEQFDLDSRL